MGVIKLKIDVTKIDKTKLFTGKNGAKYLDASILVKDNGELDEYENCGMIVQDVSKEERAAGKKGAILGNAKPLPGKSVFVNEAANAATKYQANQNFGAPTNLSDDDLPF